MKIGIITYDCPHLKTEQLVVNYVKDYRVESIEIFALPFLPRKERSVLIDHRPDMKMGVPTYMLAQLNKVKFSKWDGSQFLGDRCDIFIIGGAGILDVNFAEGKPIINAHPGIIPTTRGLDSVKWAIYFNDPVGVTLHLIDSEVDKGDILSIEHTPVFSSDKLETFFRRHYEMEINMLSNVISVLSKRVNSFGKENPAKRRMNKQIESEMILKFDSWKKTFNKINF